jgi:hypothetical protein
MPITDINPSLYGRLMRFADEFDGEMSPTTALDFPLGEHEGGEDRYRTGYAAGREAVRRAQVSIYGGQPSTTFTPHQPDPWENHDMAERDDAAPNLRVPTKDEAASLGPPRFHGGEWVFTPEEHYNVGVVTDPEDEIIVEYGIPVRYFAYEDTQGMTWFAHEAEAVVLACGAPRWGDRRIPVKSLAGALAAAERRGFTHTVDGDVVTEIDNAIKDALLLRPDDDGRCGYYAEEHATGRAEIRTSWPGLGAHVCSLVRRGPSVWQRLRSPAL